MWIGLGVFTFLPFLGIGAAIRPAWIGMAIGVVGSTVWIYGLGIPGFLAGAIGAVLGVVAGQQLRRAVLAFRGRRIAARSALNQSSGEPS